MTANQVDEPMALYRRIYRDLKESISNGTYKPGDRLPSELELARSYGVSRITSRQALDLACSEGLIIRRQGMGSFVAPARVDQHLIRLTDFVEDMSEAGLRPSSRVLHLSEEPAPAVVAGLLALPADAIVTRLDRLRLADDVPLALDWTWLPRAFGKLLEGEDLTAQTIYEILENYYQIPVLYGEYSIEACGAGPDQAELLGVVANEPLLLLSRTSFTTHHVPIYHQRRFYRADKVKYRLSLGRTDAGKAAIESFMPVFEGAARQA